MAELHRFTVQEAVNTEAAGKWDVGAATTVSSSHIDEIHGVNGKDISAYHTVGITTNQPIYFRFTATANAGCATTDLKLEIGTHFVKIPHGIGSSIFLNMLRVSSDATVNIVLS